MDIRRLPKMEIMKDRQGSLIDIHWCEMAIAEGLTKYSGGLISDRLKINREIVITIDTELARRQDK